MARNPFSRRRSSQIEILDPVRQSSLVASAVTIGIDKPPSHVLWGGAQWQLEAWAHYDTCPELHAAATVIGNAFSRAKMMAVDVDPVTGDLGDTPTDDPVAGALVANLFGGRSGQSMAQRQMGVHLTLPGDCWILASDQRPDVDAQTWQVISVSEVQKAGNLIQIENLDGTRRNLMPTELLFRLFQPHPKRRWEADSPTRAMLPVLRELAGLSAQIIASIKSRLATGGVWLLPQSATLPDTVDEYGNKLPSGAQGWMAMLARAMVTAIANPDDPSALVPIVAMIPDEVLEKIKDPFQFVREIAAEAQVLREACVKRLAIGMDMPPELLLGVGDVNHWSAWQVSEDFVKGPLTGLLALPADGFTTHYLRPGLRLAGRNPRLFAIAFDTSGLMPAVQEEHAIAAYTAGELSARALLEALHFDPVRDAVTPEERAEKLVRGILARGNPESLEELLPTIKRLFPGISLTVPIGSTGLPSPVAPQLEENAPTTAPPIAPPSTTATKSPPPRPATPPSNAPTTPPAGA